MWKNMLHISIQVNDLVSHDIMTTDRSNLVVSDLTASDNMLNMFTVQETTIVWIFLPVYFSSVGENQLRR